MNQAVDQEIYTHLRYGPTWQEDSLKWSQVKQQLQEFLQMMPS